MKEIVFATHNKNKATEVRALLSEHYKVLTLDDIGCNTDIPETGSSFAENASLKSSYVATNFNMDCFADDSGLEVEALNNEPGIYSARYSGHGDVANYQLVLQRLHGLENRKARFRTVISLLQHGKEYFFEGVLPGVILHAPVGTNGFGYDPIFQPDGYEISLAEMSMAEKNGISHRALAMKKLIAFLAEQARA
jgi:XTP/dITP diphosphohydrolase